MNDNYDNNIIWTTLGFSIERLNICDNTYVNKDYIKNMEYIGNFEFSSILKELYSDDGFSSLSWFLNMNNIRHIGRIHLYKHDVFHKLRFSHRSGGHYECWIFGLIPCRDNLWRLCPLKRNSDYDFDILEYLKGYSKRN